MSLWDYVEKSAQHGKILGKRNNLHPEKCYHLWRDYILPSVLLTQGAPRVLVDYDLLLADPKNRSAESLPI